jgi:hypothetical protein
MVRTVFHIRYLLRTLLVFLLLSLGWTICCLYYNEFTDTDKGLVSGLGFICLFALSFYIGMPPKKIKHLAVLLVAFLCVFLVSSFIIGPLFGFTTNSHSAFAIASSLFTATTLAYVLDRLYGILYYYTTIIATIGCALAAHWLWSQYSNYFNIHFSIHPRIFLFNIYQLLVLLPLALGLIIQKK